MQCYAKAFKLMPQQVTGVLQAPVNTYYSFAVLPCGSKTGWSADQMSKSALAELFLFMTNMSSPPRWVEVEYPYFSGESKVVSEG